MSLPACPFERVILSTAFACRRSQRRYIGEKEAIGCTDPGCRQHCKQLIGHFRECAKFALPELRHTAQTPHGQEMKLKIGGLTGVKHLLEANQPSPADAEGDDISDYVERLLSTCNALSTVPCELITRSIQAYRGRRGTAHK